MELENLSKSLCMKNKGGNARRKNQHKGSQKRLEKYCNTADRLNV
jgi:hypothetical protein